MQLKVSPRLRKDMELREYANCPEVGLTGTRELGVIEEDDETGQDLGYTSPQDLGYSNIPSSGLTDTPQLGAYNPKGEPKDETKEDQPSKEINGLINEFHSTDSETSEEPQEALPASREGGTEEVRRNDTETDFELTKLFMTLLDGFVLSLPA